MSIASEIQRIKNNITNAYSAIEVKGGDVQTIPNDSDHLANSIYSIPSATVGVPREVYSHSYDLPHDWFTFTLPNNATDIGDYALANAFLKSERLQSLNLNNVVNITGERALEGCCDELQYFNSLEAPNLESVTGVSALSRAFSDTGLQSAYFPKLKTINASGVMNYAFNNCKQLSTIYVPELEYINGSAAMARTFGVAAGATNMLSSVEFPSLIILKGVGTLRYMFENRTNLQTVSFPALRSDSFGTTKTQFDNMLIGITGCTVHFPSNLQSVIGNWASVGNGFGGTNTTVSFDLTPTS